jgi:UTP-glucose-1-phosphate uridylyltransferase
MGSRYGGPKQVAPVGPSGETLMDYSIFDAIRAGFGKLVFVIRRDSEGVFREKIGSKFANRIETAYAFQELDSCLDGASPPSERRKPWGTAHAVMVTHDLIDEPFAVINADDYYGPDSFTVLADHLSAGDLSRPDDYSMVGFVLRNTLSDFGSVARGVCRCDDQMFLREVTERTAIEKAGDGARYFDDSGHAQQVTVAETVSMNMWGFQPSIFGHLRRHFAEFLKGNASDPKAEFFIPLVVDALIKRDASRVKVLTSSDSWFGLTYDKDRERVVASIDRLTAAGVYPRGLWGEPCAPTSNR